MPVDEDISSLSAILLDDDYYEFLKQGKVNIDGVTVLGAAYIIPFKAKAWLDLSERKKAGASVDSRNVKKHKKDVFKLTELTSAETRIITPKSVYDDIHKFIEMMADENIDIKQLGIEGRTKEEILKVLSEMYII